MLLSTICSRAAWTFPKSTLVQGLRFTCRKPTQSLLATVTRCGCIQASRLFTSSNQLRGPGRISGIIRRSFATLGTPLSGHLSRGRQRIVGLWLLGCSGMVFVAVVLGGVTRLTESGLSMVDWHLLKGMAPPTTDEDWEKEFEKYKQYPEFRYKSLIGGDEMSLSEFKFIWMMEYMHRMWGRAIGLAFLAPMAVFWASKSLIGGDEMSLSEFKFIWMMEYMHRMWGRAIGLAFLAPMAVFWARGWFDAAMKKRMGLAGGLLIFQGLLGWYMVKSGLNPQQNSNADVPRVSQYRLALHLSSAFVLYTIFLWCGLSHVFTPYNHNVISGISKLRGLAHASKATMFLTAVMGAFVAGLDAGLTYNSWPKFADRWIPSDLWIPEQGWRNFTENATMVQFVHRGLAYATLAAVTTTWLIGRRMPLPFRSKAVLNSLFLVIYAQAAIGVFTLLHYVPVWLGALHQSGSLVSLTFAFWLTNELRRFPK